MAGGIPALGLPFLPYWFWLALAACALILSYVLKPRHAWWLRVISKPSDRNKQVITGSRIYAWVVAVLLLMWPVFTAIHASGTFLIMFGWLALALGDGLAGLLGPGPSVATTVPWNRHKTWWGSFGCLLGTFAAGLLAYTFDQPELHHGISIGLLLFMLFAISAVTALLESFELKIDDNWLVGLAPPALALGLIMLLQ